MSFRIVSPYAPLSPQKAHPLRDIPDPLSALPPPKSPLALSFQFSQWYICLVSLSYIILFSSEFLIR